MAEERRSPDEEFSILRKMVNAGLGKLKDKAKEIPQRTINKGVNAIGDRIATRDLRKQQKIDAKERKEAMKAYEKQRKEDLRINLADKNLTTEKRTEAAEELKRIKEQEKQQSSSFKAAKGAGRAVGSFTKGVFGKSMLVGSALKNTHGVTILFILALIIHVVDAFFVSFNRGTQWFGTMLVLYIALAFFAALVAFKRESITESLSANLPLCLGLSIGAFAVPWLLNLFLEHFPNLTWLNSFILVTPVWVFYLAFIRKTESKFIHFFAALYLIFWLCIILFYVSKNVGSLPVPKTGPIDTQGVFFEFTDKVKEVFGKSVQGIIAFPAKILNATKIPDPQYEFGTEESTPEPLGVFLNNLKPLEPAFFNDTPVVVLGLIDGKSNEFPIEVTTSCYVKKPDYTIEGTTTPQHFIIEEKGQEYLECDVKPLDTGHYTIVLSSTFNFETNSHTTYTFVDSELAKSYYVAGKDINKELDIDKTPISEYSNGPVAIKTMDIMQPIKIEPDINPLFGVTVEKAWTDGSIERVTEFIISIPNTAEFDQSDCTRTITNSFTEGDRNVYEFKNLDLKESYQTITCRLKIKDKDAFLKLKENAKKVTYTFDVKTKYIYKIEKQITVTVK